MALAISQYCCCITDCVCSLYCLPCLRMECMNASDPPSCNHCYQSIRNPFPSLLCSACKACRSSRPRRATVVHILAVMPRQLDLLDSSALPTLHQWLPELRRASPGRTALLLCCCVGDTVWHSGTSLSFTIRCSLLAFPRIQDHRPSCGRRYVSFPTKLAELELWS